MTNHHSSFEAELRDDTMGGCALMAFFNSRHEGGTPCSSHYRGNGIAFLQAGKANQPRGEKRNVPGVSS